MALRIMADNSQPISCSQDAALYNVLCNDKNFVIKGIGDEFGIDYSSTSMNITIKSGECVICGRHIYSTGNNTLTLPANTSRRVVLRYDMTNPDFCSFVLLTTGTPIKHENINNNGTYSDLELGVVYTNGSGVEDFFDRRTKRGSMGMWETLYGGAIFGGQSIDLDTSKYSKLRITAVLGDVNGSFEIDLDVPLNYVDTETEPTYASSCVVSRYLNSRFQNYMCYAGVNETKTKFMNVDMGLYYATTNTRKNNNESYYITKIEGME